MKRNIKFERLTTDLMIFTIDFKGQFDRLKAELNKALEDIENTYKNGSAKDEKIKAVKESFAKQFTDLRLEYAKNCTESIGDVREAEREKISVINESKLAKLKAISDIPLSAEEMVSLIDSYKFSDDYWCERYVKMIAEKNGFCADGVMEADYSVKMSVLDQFQQQAEEMIMYYDGMDRKDSEWRQRTVWMNLSEDVMNNALSIWYGKYNIASDNELADKAYLTIKSKQTDVEKSIALNNVLRNSTGETRNALLTAIAMDNDISQSVYRLSGFNEELMAFRNGKAKEYLEAQKIVKEAEAIADQETRGEYLKFNSGNEFLYGLVKSSAKKDNVFKSFIAECETKAEGEAKIE